jgi:flagellin
MAATQLGTTEKKLSSLDLTTFAGAQEAISVIDSAISQVSSERAELGNFQTNVLESTLANLQVAYENLNAADSTLRDTDMASEMAEFTKNQILQQASISMLAQANQQPQAVLSLLG